MERLCDHTSLYINACATKLLFLYIDLHLRCLQDMLSTDQRWKNFSYYKSKDPEYHSTAIYILIVPFYSTEKCKQLERDLEHRSRKEIGRSCYVNFDHALYFRKIHNTYIIPEDR